MKSIFFSKSFIATMVAAISAATVIPAQALTSRQTTFNEVDGGRQVIFDWSYDSSAEDDGLISLEELEEWSWSLFSATDQFLFQETVVQSGTNLNGSPTKFRFLTTDLFEPTTPSQSFLDFDTGGSTTFFFLLLGTENRGLIIPGMDTIFFDMGVTTTIMPGGGSSSSQSTPEPTTVLGFITLGGVLLGNKRKNKS